MDIVIDRCREEKLKMKREKRDWIKKIHSDYLNDCESESEMEEIFDLAFYGLQSKDDEFEAESVIVKGQWIRLENTDIYMCGECGFGYINNGYFFRKRECVSANRPYHFRFCPKCGIEMDDGWF